MSSPLYRFASWAAVFALVLLSLVPGSVRPHTGLPGPVEHFLAYFLTGVLLGARKRGTAYRIAVAVSLSIASGIFELLQNFVPGREAGVFDFLVSSGGAAFGVCAVAIACHYMYGRKDAGERSSMDGERRSIGAPRQKVSEEDNAASM